MRSKVVLISYEKNIVRMNLTYSKDLNSAVTERCGSTWKDGQECLFVFLELLEQAQ